MSALRAVLSRHGDLLRRESALADALAAERRRAGILAAAVDAIADCPADATETEARDLSRILEAALAAASAQGAKAESASRSSDGTAACPGTIPDTR
jgi:hypothetical protein